MFPFALGMLKGSEPFYIFNDTCLRAVIFLTSILVDASKPVNLTHSGGCDPQSTGYIDNSCTLPVDANITLIPQGGNPGDPVGVGVKVDANISIDLYARKTGSPPNYVYTPAIQYQDQTVGTLIRVTLPVGFVLCSSVVTLQGNTMVLQDESWPTGMKLGPWPNTSFRQILPFQKGNGVREPVPGSVDATSRLPYRVGIYSGLLDPPNWFTRCFEINITSNATATTAIPNITQRLTFTISNILTVQTVGPIPSPVDASVQQMFAIQIYQITKVSGTTTYTMNYYNNRINDIRLVPPSVYFWFKSTFVGSSVLTSNKLCSSCAQLSLTSTKMDDTSSAIFTITNISPIPAGGVVRLQFAPVFDLSAVLLNTVTVSAVDTIADGNAWGPVNATKSQSNLLLIGRSNLPNSAPIYSGTTVVITVPRVHNPSAAAAPAKSMFLANVSTGPGGADNSTYDSGFAYFPLLSPSSLQGISIILSSYKVGSYPVTMNVSFSITQQIGNGGSIFISVPTLDVDFPLGGPIFLSKGIIYPVATVSLPTGYTQLQYNINITIQMRSLTISLGQARNRGYAGPSSLPFLIWTKTGQVVLESGAANLSQPFQPSSLSFLDLWISPQPAPYSLVSVTIRAKLTNTVPSRGMISVSLPQYYTGLPATNVYISFGSNFFSVPASSLMFTAPNSFEVVSVFVLFEPSWMPVAGSLMEGSFVSLNITNVQCPPFVAPKNGSISVSTFYSHNPIQEIDTFTLNNVVMHPNKVNISSIIINPQEAGAQGSITVNFILTDSIPLDGKLVFVFPPDYVVAKASVRNPSEYLTDCCSLQNSASMPYVLMSIEGSQVELQLFSAWTLASQPPDPSIRYLLLEYNTNESSSWAAACTTSNPFCLGNLTHNSSSSTPIFVGSRPSMVKFDGIKFPGHGGSSGDLQIFSLTADNFEIDTTVEAFPMPFLNPGSLQNLTVTFQSLVVAHTGPVAISFRTKTAINHSAGIVVNLPDGFVCSGKFNVSVTQNVSDWSHVSNGNCSGTGLVEYVVGGPGVLHAGSVVNIQIDHVRNRYFGAGPSKQITVDTVLVSATGLYVIDSGTVNGPNLTASTLSEVSVQITSLIGGPPQAGQEVLVSIQLRADQPIALSMDGRIVLNLQETGLEFPTDQDSISVDFFCPRMVHLTQYCANSAINSEFGVILPCSKCYFPAALASIEESKLTIQYREWSILPERQTVQPIDVPPGYTLNFTVYNLLAANTSQQMKDMQIELQGLGPGSSELQIFESSTPIQLAFIMPCKLLSVNIIQSYSAAVVLSFSLCQPLTPAQEIHIEAPCWIDCNQVACDAYNSLNCFRIVQDGVLSAQISPSPDAWFLNSSLHTGFGTQLYSTSDISSNTAIVIEFSGLGIPISPGLSRVPCNLSIYVKQQSSLYSSATILFLQVPPRTAINQTLFVSFLSGMDISNEDGGLGFAFVIGSRPGGAPSKVTVLLTSDLNIYQLSVSNLMINNTLAPGSVNFDFSENGADPSVNINLSSYQQLLPGTLLQFNVSGFKNPNAGFYVLPGLKLLDANGWVLDEVLSNSKLTVIVKPGILTSMFFRTTSQYAGELCNISIRFVSRSPLNPGDQIVIESTGGIKALQWAGVLSQNGLQFIPCSSSSDLFQICLGLTSSSLPMSLFDFTIYGLQNSPYVATQQWSIRTQLATGTVLDQSNDVFETVLHPGHANAMVDILDKKAGSIGSVLISFQAINPLHTGDYIEVTFPGGDSGYKFLSAAQILETSGLGQDWTLTIQSLESDHQVRMQLISTHDQTTEEVVINSGQNVSFVLGARLRAPLHCGEIDPIIVESYSNVSGVYTAVDSSSVVTVIVPNTLASPLIAPQSTNSRAGLSQDSRLNNYANISFFIFNSISENDLFAIQFPAGFASSLQQQDPGCPSGPILSCITSISCIEGCTESLKIILNRSLIIVFNGKVLNQTYDLVAQRTGSGEIIQAGSAVILQIRTFGIPSGKIGPTGSFILSTATSNGYVIDTGAAVGFQILPGLFQNLVMPAPNSSMPSAGQSSCVLQQPTVVFSNTVVGHALFFPVIEIRVTNMIDQNGFLYISIPKPVVSSAKPDVTSLVNMTICPPSNNSYPTTVLDPNRQGCVNMSSFSSLNNSSPSSIGLMVPFEFPIQEDSSVILWNVGLAFGLQNRPWAGQVGLFTVSTFDRDGILLDTSNFIPSYCISGQIQPIQIIEAVVFMNNGLCQSNVVAGGAGNVSIKMAAQLQLVSNLTVLVYLPIDFSVSNLQTKIQSSSLWNTKTTVGNGSGIWSSGSSANRTIITMQVQGITAFKANETISLAFQVLNNPQYAAGYPVSAYDSSDLTLAVRFLSLVSTSQGLILAPVFRYEWTLITVPRTLQNLTISYQSLATAEIERLNISFAPRVPIAEFARFVIWFPVGSSIDGPFGGFDFSEASASINIGPSGQFSSLKAGVLSASVVAGAEPIDIASPVICNPYSGLDLTATFSLTQGICLNNPTCTIVSTNQGSFSASSLLLQRSLGSVLNGSFMVPMINGVICSMQEPIIAQPGSWVVPPGCNISQTYKNITTVLRFQYPLDIIPANSLVSIQVTGVRNPLRFANCSGWFDVQVEETSTIGWAMTQRELRSCQATFTQGSLTGVQLFLSNANAGPESFKFLFKLQ